MILLFFYIKTSYIMNFFVKLIFILYLTTVLNSSFAQNLLTTPECASFDASRKRYLVSCYETGNIVQIDSNGVQSYFLTGFGHVLSNTIKGNIFYFSNISSVKGYDISVTPPQQVMNIYIPSSVCLDGMVTDASGNLYICDMDYPGSNDKIYKINLSTHSWSIFVPPGHGLGSPEDIEIDLENNRLIVANWFDNCPIQAVSLSDSSVTNIVQNSIGNFDGIAADNSGNYYFTSWTLHKVYKYDKSFANSPVVIASGFNGPSNLSYNPIDNILVVPNFVINTLTYIHLNTIGIKKIDNIITNVYSLFQNYPNPFNPSTKIRFSIGPPLNPLLKAGLRNEGIAILRIYDILGKEVATLINEQLSAGTYEVEWNAEKYPGGIYFYRLTAGNNIITKKMILLK
jgi:hypothetical protein